MRQKRRAERAALAGSYSPPCSAASLTVGAVGTSLVSWTAMVTVTLAPLAKVKVTGTAWAGNRSVLRPVSVTLGSPLPIPICTDWRPPSWIGVFWEAAPEEPVAEGEPAAELLAEGEALAEAEAVAEPVAEAEPLAEGLDADAAVLAAELSAAAVEDCPDPDACDEELEPALIRTPEAIGEVTETSLSGVRLRLTSTMRSGASEPLR